MLLTKGNLGGVHIKLTKNCGQIRHVRNEHSSPFGTRHCLEEEEEIRAGKRRGLRVPCLNQFDPIDLKWKSMRHGSAKDNVSIAAGGQDVPH